MLVFLFGGIAAPRAFAETEVDWATAAERCDRQLLATPRDDKTWADLVQARLNLGDLRRAEEALKIWRRNNPKAPKACPSIERLQGDLAYSRGDAKGAADAWRAYVRLAPQDVESWDRLAGAEEELGHVKDAIDAVGHALKTEPDAARYAWRARLKIQLRDWSGANADVRAGNKLDATDAAIQALYPKFERMNRWLPALKKLDGLVNWVFRDPSHPVPLLNRSEFLANEKWLDLAYEDAEEALRRAPDSLRARYWRGVLAWELGRISEVGDVSKTNVEAAMTGDLDRVKKIADEVDPEVRAHVLLEMRQAVMALREVEGIDGSVLKVSAYVDLKQLPKAEAAARRAVEVHPKAADAWSALGWLELTNGNMKEAMDCADRLAKLNAMEKALSLRAEARKRLGIK